MYPALDNNTKNASIPKPKGNSKANGFTDVQVDRDRLQRRRCVFNLTRNVTSSEMMLFIISLMMVLLGGYILLKPQFTKSTLMDLVDEKVEAELQALEATVKDNRRKMQSLQEDRAHLESLINQVNQSLVIVRSAMDYNITELQLKIENLDAKIHLQDQSLKDLEEKGQRMRESFEEFANVTKDNFTEALRQQLFLQESIQQVNESMNTLAHVTHSNITVQHNSTSKLTERMEQAEKEVEKYAASAQHLKRIDHTVAQLVSFGNIPMSSLFTILSVSALFFLC